MEYLNIHVDLEESIVVNILQEKWESHAVISVFERKKIKNLLKKTFRIKSATMHDSKQSNYKTRMLGSSKLFIKNTKKRFASSRHLSSVKS